MNKEEIQSNEKICEDFKALVQKWNEAHQVCTPDEYALRQKNLLHSIGVFLINFMQINFEIIQPEKQEESAESCESCESAPQA